MGAARNDFKPQRALQVNDLPGKISGRSRSCRRRGLGCGADATLGAAGRELGCGRTTLNGVEEIRPRASRLAFSILLATGCGVAIAQGGPNDGINRNLLQREQKSADFHVRLYDTGRAAGQDALIPLPPVPHSFIGPELYQVPSGGPPGGTGSTGAADRQQLNDSQLRRQLELQTHEQALRRADSAATEPNPAASVRP